MSRLRSAIAGRLRDEGGWTLTELLITIVLMLIVLSATLTALERFTENARVNNRLNDTQDRARFAIEQVARQLRNLAVPTGNASSIDFAGRYDLIFKTADPTRRRVRYCLDATSPSNARLYRQLQTTGAGDVPIVAADHDQCPDVDTGVWDPGTVVSDAVVNTIPIGGVGPTQDRPVFSYACSSACPAVPVGTAPTDLSMVTEVRAELFLDVNGPTTRPVETRLATGIYLRNQNQKPLATWTSRLGVGVNNFRFNGSDSSDAENRTLAFFWFRESNATKWDAVAASVKPATEACADEPTCIGVGVALSHTFPDATNRDVTLLVRDPGGLTDFETKNCNPTNGVCS